MLRKILALLGVLVVLPVLALGLKFLYYWARTHAGDSYYVDFAYGAAAAQWLVWVGVILLVLAGAVMKKKSGGALMLLAGWVLIFLLAIAIPSNVIDPLQQVRADASLRLREVQIALESSATRTGKLPSSQSELDAVIKQYGSDNQAVRFLQNGRRLPFRVFYLGDARAPVLSPPAVPPGTVICGINLELNQYWLTSTTLPLPVSKQVIMQSDRGSAPMMLGGLIQRAAPNLTAAKP